MFDAVGMAALREQSVALTAYLEAAIDALVPDAEIITPRDPTARGAQLSVRVPDAPARLAAIEALDVVADFREPDIVRLAPAPLYYDLPRRLARRARAGRHDPEGAPR